MKKQETIKLLKAQLPGFYSVEQVINLIEGIEEPKSSMDAGKVIELIGVVQEAVAGEIESSDSDDVVDYTSAEFRLSGNEIELDRIELETRSIKRITDSAIESAIQDYFSEAANED